MGLNAQNYTKGGSDYGKANVGPHVSRFVGVIELGVHPGEFEGKPKPPKPKLNLIFELTDDFITFENGTKMPRWVSKTVNATQDKKGALTKILAAIDPAGLYRGDLAAMARATLPCLVTIEAAGESVKISQVGGLPPQFEATCPAAVNQPVVFDWDNPDMATLFSKSVANWIREEIKTADNFPGSRVQGLWAQAEAFYANQGQGQSQGQTTAPVASTAPVQGHPQQGAYQSNTAPAPAYVAPQAQRPAELTQNAIAPAPAPQMAPQAAYVAPATVAPATPSAPPGWAFVNGAWVPSAPVTAPVAAQAPAPQGAGLPPY